MGSGVGRKRKEEMKHEEDGRKWRETVDEDGSKQTSRVGG
jgi:hypothetical protein